MPHCPPQELRQAVHLVVVATVRKGQDLREEVFEPGRRLRQQDVACLDDSRLAFGGRTAKG